MSYLYSLLRHLNSNTSSLYTRTRHLYGHISDLYNLMSHLYSLTIAVCYWVDRYDEESGQYRLR